MPSNANMPSLRATLAVALAACGTAVVASPITAPAPTPAPDAAHIAKRATSCTFSGDDGAASASKSKSDCATIVLSDVAVPSGTTLDLTDLEDGTAVIFEGTTTFGYDEWEGPLVSISGTDIAISGAADAVLDGDGSRWWDGYGSNSGGVTKPKFFYAHDLLGSSTIDDIYILNPPVQVFSIDGAEGLKITNPTIDASDGDADDLGHNTDCFDVGSSSSITISGATCMNQDDCLAINSGTDITFTGGTCSGGHGLSIGSVGGRDDNTVDTVTISSSSISDSDNGVRIKTVSGATGSVSGVTYEDITLSNIAKYGVVIEQDYENGSPTGDPTDGVPITGLTLDGISGTVASDGVDIYILCAEDACSDWTWTGVDVTGGETSDDCENVPDAASC